MDIHEGRRYLAAVATIERLLQHGMGPLYVAVRLDEIRRIMTGEYCTSQMAIEAGIEYADRLVLTDESRRAEERKAVQ